MIAMEAFAVSNDGKSSHKQVLKRVELKAKTTTNKEIPWNDIFSPLKLNFFFFTLHSLSTDCHKLP
jgi:hypothetical protein